MKWYKLFFIISLLGCQNENEILYSNLDGINHEDIMNGPLNSEKHILSLLYDVNTEPDSIFLDEILLKLELNSEQWRLLAFQAIGSYCINADNSMALRLQTSIFNYFLYFPKEYISLVSKFEYEKSDCILELFSKYVQKYIQTNQITIVSMKNVAYKYCKGCTDSEISKIYQYLDLASKYASD